MRYAFSLLLAVHGIAHVPGFLVSWRLMQSQELAYKTTVLAGRLDVGDGGIRVVGAAWLVTAALLLAVAVGVAVRARWAEALMPGVVLMSLVLCVLELPHSRIGLVVNVVALLFLAVHPTLGAGALRWDHVSADARGRLASAARPAVGQFTSWSSPGSSVPAPVRRYLESVFQPDAQPPSLVTLTQEGEFRMGEDDDSWKPFTATQHISLSPPGFIWDANIRIAPGVRALVRDSYINGMGGMHASAQGLFTIINAPPSDALSRGALQRWLAESVWVPFALHPERGVLWDPIDDDRAHATIVDHGHRVSIEVTVSATGDITRVFIPDRMREIDGRYEPTPWDVVCADHQWHGGVRVPVTCEVAWLLPGGRLPYWRGRITSVVAR